MCRITTQRKTRPTPYENIAKRVKWGSTGT